MITLRCPVTGEALIEGPPGTMVGMSGRVAYPVVDGIPVLLAHESERTAALARHAEAAAGVDPPEGTPASRINFYNRVRDQDRYCRPELPDVRDELLRLQRRFTRSGPVLEIGSGMGSLQGLFEPYVALDYSLTALARYVDKRHQRVCASAEQIPFFDETFALVYSIATLEHVRDPAAAVEEVDRVLMPGGIAFLLPAWHAVQYNCDGIPVRRYRDLPLRHRFVKATLPLRRLPAAKAAGALPGRLFRQMTWTLRPEPTHLRYRRLRADYSTFWLSDSDACARLDSHEASLFFRSRDYDVLSPGMRARDQLLARHVPVIARKPTRS